MLGELADHCRRLQLHRFWYLIGIISFTCEFAPDFLPAAIEYGAFDSCQGIPGRANTVGMGCDFSFPAVPGVRCSIRGADGRPVEDLDFAIDEDPATGATEEKKPDTTSDREPE